MSNVSTISWTDHDITVIEELIEMSNSGKLKGMYEDDADITSVTKFQKVGGFRKLTPIDNSSIPQSAFAFCYFELDRGTIEEIRRAFENPPEKQHAKQEALNETRHQETLAVAQEANNIANDQKRIAWIALGLSGIATLISAIALYTATSDNNTSKPTNDSPLVNNAVE